MGNPLTIMAGAGLASSAASGIFGALGAKQSGDAQAKMYQYQAGVAQYNKAIAEQNRDFAYHQGEEEASRYGFKARQEIGAEIVDRSASGLDISSGSAPSVIASQRAKGQIDLQTIRNNAARAAYGYEVQAGQEEMQSRLYSQAASDAKAGEKWGIIGSLLGGASSVSSKWLQGRQRGVW